MPIAMVTMKDLIHKGAWAFLFLSVFLLPLSGETVMVSLKGSHQGVLSAIEGGVMEILFDAGFIVFNGTFHTGSGVYPPLDDFKTAREGGATLLMALETTVKQSSPQEPVLPNSLRFWLLRISDRKILVEGKIEATELQKQDSESWEQYADRWGKEAAKRVVKGYR